MTWFKVDDGFQTHPKVLALDPAIRLEAIGAWTLCGANSARHRTDGRVTKAELAALGVRPEVVDALVESGLWRRGSDRVVVFHDWGEWQVTRRSAEKTSEVNAKNGEVGGRNSGIARKSGSASLPSIEAPGLTLPIPSHPIPEDSLRSSSETRAREDPPPPENLADMTSELLRALNPPMSEHERLVAHARSALRQGYAERYERAANFPWLSYAANDREIGQVATWAIAAGFQSDHAIVDRALDAFFRDKWASANNWPWKFFAKDPARFLREPAKTETFEERKARVFAAMDRGESFV